MPDQDAPPFHSADDTDVWYRHMPVGFKRLADGSVHRQFLKSLSPPRAEWNRPWALEISGRVLSLGADDIEERAERAVESVRNSFEASGRDASVVRFRGLVAIGVREARGFTPLKCDVAVEPRDRDEDPAHANFTVDQDFNLQSLEIQRTLSKLFSVIEPEEIDNFAKLSQQRESS